MKKWSRLFIIIPILLLVIYLLWFFSTIVLYVLISLGLSFIGKPLVKNLNNIKIGKFKFPNGLSALLTLLLILFVFILIIHFIIPIITSQANMITSIDLQRITIYYKAPINTFENLLRNYGFISNHQTLEGMISSKIMQLLHVVNFSDVFSYGLSFVGSFLIGTFAVLFITFFFLKDVKLFSKVILLLTPDKYHNEANHIMEASAKLITRYLLGLLMEILSMTLLLYIGLMIIGIKSAFLIAFIGGLLVVIPYVGFIIGALLGVLIGITSGLSFDLTADIAKIAIEVLCMFGATKIIDDFVLQPLIYANSVKAHPLEIFLVIMIAGSIAGISGMVLAIPVYTFLRIVAKEFLTKSKLINKLTEHL